MATAVPTIRLTSESTARGLLLKAPETLKTVYAFLGIPYAEPPVRSLRFKPTKRTELWKGERDCTQYGHIAIQDTYSLQRMMRPFKVPNTASEDCLYLNVWTPTLDAQAKLPVMIWIHGGAFSTGYSDFYDGTVICGFQDVIVVSINYRLGAFGFLSTGDGVIKGNMGLLDQVEAIRWVKQNIHSFGGDPNNITLFGESAGSISIAFHLLSPLTRGLFRRAICQSGASIYPSGVWPQRNMAKFLLKKLQNAGVQAKDGKEIEKYLSELSPDEIRSICGEVFQPTVDGTFLPDLPENLYKQGYLYRDVDAMIGFNSDEGAMFIYGLNDWKPIQTEENAESILSILVDVSFFRGSKHAAAIKELMRKEYFKGENTSQNWTHGLVQMYGDLLFVAPSFRIAELQSELGTGATYVYAFEERPTVSRYPRYIKADHSQEIMFVFGEPYLRRLPEQYSSIWSDEERELTKRFVQLWCDFAKTGNPNGENPVHWPRFTKQTQEYLSIQHACEVKSRHQTARMRLWNETIPALLAGSKY